MSESVCKCGHRWTQHRRMTPSAGCTVCGCPRFRDIPEPPPAVASPGERGRDEDTAWQLTPEEHERISMWIHYNPNTATSSGSRLLYRRLANAVAQVSRLESDLRSESAQVDLFTQRFRRDEAILTAKIAALESELSEAKADRERLTRLQRICGMRRTVQIETCSTGTTIDVADSEGDFLTIGRGPGLRDAIDGIDAARSGFSTGEMT